ncbi:MAG: hypothetical protein LBC99_03765 [Spirochaetota bacterium]|nr:hypothetical protein [Spirochaetota bacterium]
MNSDAQIVNCKNGSGDGGGVRVEANATFTMNSGSLIMGCASNGNGGGVFVGVEATFIMNSDALIDGNQAGTGKGAGGVYCYGGNFTMNDGTISNNTGKNAGGGVCVDGPSAGPKGTFTMHYGKICGNSSTQVTTDPANYWYQGAGGGVFVHGVCTFTMKGGSISDNWAANTGGGVCMRADSIFTKTGGTIYGANAGTSDQNRVGENGEITDKGAAVHCGDRKRCENTVENGMTTDTGWEYP